MTMEIRSLRIDFDNDVLEVNGKKYDRPAIIKLPSEGGWKISKLFSIGNEPVPREECDVFDLSVLFSNKL